MYIYMQATCFFSQAVALFLCEAWHYFCSTLSLLRAVCQEPGALPMEQPQLYP